MPGSRNLPEPGPARCPFKLNYNRRVLGLIYYAAGNLF